jgi:MFS family permease
VKQRGSAPSFGTAGAAWCFDIHRAIWRAANVVESLAQSNTGGMIIESNVPARLDRLPWGGFHWRIVIALGITWILDGLEVTLAGTLAGAIKDSLHLTNAGVGLASTAYLLGAVTGALYFGWLTDRLGRRKLFFITLAVYAIFTVATAFSWSIEAYALFRFLTGAGIGGEYAAINSAIQEFIPARYRGRTDLAINGSYWLGAAIGALGSTIALNAVYTNADLGWRAAFFAGGALATLILFFRMWIPESPRWLIRHGRAGEGEAIIGQIEDDFRAQGWNIPAVTAPPSRLRARRFTPLREVWRTLFHDYRRRSLVGLVLMGAQAFFYNAIFFTYALVLTDFFDVPSNQAGWYILPFAIGNFLGPLLLGWAFDNKRLGRRIMIALTYALSGILLAISGALFAAGAMTAVWQTVSWSVIFFFASAAASSAYLTVSETFPLEVRALAIAIFFAIGTGVGGALSPWLFGLLIDTGSRVSLFIGYLLGAVLMIGAAIVQWRFGIDSEGKSLEEVAKPLTSVD